jgi:hypothetical protein
MLQTIGAKLRAFGCDRTGVAALEFSIVAWPFFGVVFMIFNTMLVHYFRTSLDGAVQNLAMDLRSGGNFILRQARATTTDRLGNTVAYVDVAVLRNRLRDYFPPGMDANEVLIEVFTRNTCKTNYACWDDAYEVVAKAQRKSPKFNVVSSNSYLGATGSTGPSGGNPASRAVQLGAAGDSQYLVVYYPMSPISTMFASRDSVILPPTSLVDSAPERRVFGLVSTAMWINDPSVGVF